MSETADGTEYVPKIKTATHRPNIGDTDSVELPDEATGVTVDYEAGTLGGGKFIIRYLVPGGDSDE